MHVPPTPHVLAALIAATLTAFASAGAAAQTIRGVVVEDATGQPLTGATVVALDSTGAARAATLGDEAGRFVLRLPGPGPFTLRADRIGFAPHVLGPVYLDALPVFEVELRMATEPVRLDPVRATTERRDRRLVRNGYYRREHMGIGRFVTRERIERENPLQVTDVLRTEPSVKVVCAADEHPDCRPYFRRSAGMFLDGDCSIVYVLDGQRLGQPPPALDALVHPGDVEAMEIYPGGHGAPAQFKSPCGTIMIWTKRG